MGEHKNRTPWIIVGLLAAMNLGLLAFIWANSSQEQGPNLRTGGKQILIERLEMDEAQQVKFEAEYDRHQGQVQGLQVELRRKKDELFAFEKELDVEKLAKEIGALHAELDVTTYRHFENVRSFLRPDQKEEFQKVFQEIFGPKARGKHGPPPGRGGPPPPRRH